MTLISLLDKHCVPFKYSACVHLQILSMHRYLFSHCSWVTHVELKLFSVKRTMEILLFLPFFISLDKKIRAFFCLFSKSDIIHEHIIVLSGTLILNEMNIQEVVKLACILFYISLQLDTTYRLSFLNYK